MILLISLTLKIVSHTRQQFFHGTLLGLKGVATMDVARVGDGMFRERAGDKNLTKLVDQGKQLRARNVLHQHNSFQVMVAMEILGEPANHGMS